MHLVQKIADQDSAVSSLPMHTCCMLQMMYHLRLFWVSSMCRNIRAVTVQVPAPISCFRRSHQPNLLVLQRETVAVSLITTMSAAYEANKQRC